MQKLLTRHVLQEPEGSQETDRARSPRSHKASKTAADSAAFRGSDAPDSDAQLSSEAEDPGEADKAAQLEEDADHTQEEEQTQTQHDPDIVQLCPVDTEQQDSMSQPPHKAMADAGSCEGGQQQSVTEGLSVLNSLPAQRKEPLCLRVRPLDSPTRRLMQCLGCTPLLEMPNNK